MEEMIGGGSEDLLAKTDKDIAINSGETNPEATVEPVASDNIIAEDAESDAKVAGVKAYMNAILVNKLVEFGGTGGSAESFGFDVEKPSDAYGFNGSEEDVPI